MEKDKIQQIQEDEYNFPYHYIPRYKGYFSQCISWSWGINYTATIEFLIEKLKNEKFQSLVDIGCGDGRLTKDLQEEFKNKDVEGIDYSERSIALAKAMNPTGIYHCLDITKKQLNKKFDGAILMEVFEHIPPDIGDIFLNSVANFIKKDGFLMMTVPHINMPVESKHYRHFSIESISRCLEKKFEICETIPFENKDKRKRVIDSLLGNNLYILNSEKINTGIYKFYKENLFFVDKEEKCKRIFIKAKPLL